MKYHIKRLYAFSKAWDISVRGLPNWNISLTNKGFKVSGFEDWFIKVRLGRNHIYIGNFK